MRLDPAELVLHCLRMRITCGAGRTQAPNQTLWVSLKFFYINFKTFFCCCCSVTKLCLFVTPWTVACQAPLFSTISQSLLKFTSVELVMPPNHLILCCPLLLPPSIFPSIRVFSNESALRIRWPKYWRFSFRISPSNEYSGLISFKIDWFNLFVVQGTLKSLLQHHSLKASMLRCSAFFKLPYNVVLISALQQSESAICIHTYPPA